MNSGEIEKKSVQAETFTLGFLIGLLGYALTILWICSFFLYGMCPLGWDLECNAPAVTLVYAISVAVFFALTYIFHDCINSKKGLQIALVAGLLSAVAYEVMFFTPASVIPAAFASVVLFQFWSSFLCKYTQIRIYVGIVALFCGVAIILVAYLDAYASFVFVRLLPMMSGLLLLLRMHQSVEDWISVSKKDSESRFFAPVSSLAAVCSDGMLAGIASYLLVFSGSPSSSVMLVAALAVMVVGVLLLLDVGKGRMNEEFFLKSYTLRLAPFLLMIPFLSGVAINLCACCLIVSFAINISMVISAHTERVRFNQLSSLCMFGYSFALFFVFCAMGWGISMGFEIVSAGTLVKALVVYSLLVVLIAVNTYLFQDQYPNESEREEVVEVEAESHDGHIAPWRFSTRAISEVYGLSPRQTEVFELLAKGRNCEFISQEFYISRATAKAHINTIYKKIGVHSQQELINLVEEFSVKNKAK